MSQDKHSIPGDFEVIRCELPAFAGDFTQMDYGDPLAERTVQLREEYRLDEVVAGYETEFAAQRALKRWVRSRWNHGWSLAFNTVQDALDILHEVDRGEQFTCGFYSRVFVECARSLGWVARSIGLGVRDIAFPRGHNVGNVGHVVPEIWSDQYRKWILMDPDLNVHYERDGVPLSALELHDAWLAHEAEAVAMVQEEPAFVCPSGEHVNLVRQMMDNMDGYTEQTVVHAMNRFSRYNVLDYYARLTIGNFTWLDDRCLPSFVVHFAPGGTKLLTSNPADVNWTVNMVRLAASPSWVDGPKLSLALQHCMPWFDHCEARVDGGAWEPRPETFDWPMREGENVLEVRPVNVCGRPGITSRLEVAYAPARW